MGFWDVNGIRPSEDYLYLRNMNHDLAILAGSILDGTGNPWYRADLGIAAGRIVRTGEIDGIPAARTIDADGLVVAPGFIDLHSHSDFAVLEDPLAESKVKQGVTTEVNGNCGQSAGPLRGSPVEGVRPEASEVAEPRWSTLGGYFTVLEETGISVNVASLVGHGTVRRYVMGDGNRKPTAQELNGMQLLVDEAMRDGALGLSSGLDRGLVPGCYAEKTELVELCRVVAQHRGFYATHMRNRQERVLEAAREAVEISEEAGVPVQISHFVPRFPDGDKTLACMGIVEAARRRGLDVSCDVVIPNPRDGFHWANGSLATQVLPLWAYEGGRERLLERLKDPDARRRMRGEAEPLWGIWRAGRWDRLILHTSRGSPDLVGRTFEEIARMSGTDAWDAAYDLLLAEEGESCGILGPSTEEGDSLAVMRYPWCSLESDRATHTPRGPLGGGGADANSYGAFPRVFRKYVRELGVMTLEEAVRKMTSLPAQRCGLQDRGVLREGAWADIVIFDPERIADRATIEEPARFPDGIQYVLVNGQVVVENGEHTGARPGRVLRAHR